MHSPRTNRKIAAVQAKGDLSTAASPDAMGVLKTTDHMNSPKLLRDAEAEEKLSKVCERVGNFNPGPNLVHKLCSMTFVVDSPGIAMRDAHITTQFSSSFF